MECAHCKSDNDQSRRFCRSCGKPLGALCVRCKTLNKYDDVYCGACGSVLATAESKERVFSPAALDVSNIPRQYTDVEIDELLILRRLARDSERALEQLTQGDIDDLFK